MDGIVACDCRKCGDRRGQSLVPPAEAEKFRRTMGVVDDGRIQRRAHGRKIALAICRENSRQEGLVRVAGAGHLLLRCGPFGLAQIDRTLRYRHHAMHHRNEIFERHRVECGIEGILVVTGTKPPGSLEAGMSAVLLPPVPTPPHIVAEVVSSAHSLMPPHPPPFFSPETTAHPRPPP